MKRVKREGSKFVREMAQNECFLCQPLDDSLLVWEDDELVVLLDKFPSVAGHLVIAPKRHVEAISELSKMETHRLIDLVRRFDVRLRDVFKPFRVAIVSSGMAVKHLHFHVIPIPTEEMMWGFKYLDKSETIAYSTTDKQKIIQQLTA